MSCGSPYIGSKISLISKMKIRYEGILYTINTEDATVALAKVKSYGTEGRKCERQVAARDEVYEYIIFRGADIFDLTVCEPPKPVPSPTAPTLTQDPAIVQSVVTSQANTLPPLVGSGYAPPQIGFNAYPPHSMGFQSMAPGQMPPDPSKPPPMLPPSNLQNPLKPGLEKSSDGIGRTSPTLEQGVQTGNPPQSQNSFQQRRTYESNEYYNSGHSNNFQSQHQRDGYDDHRGRGGNRQYHHQRSNNENRDGEYDSRGRGGGQRSRGDYRGDHHSSNYRGNRPQRGGRRFTPRNDPLRFDGDFDFETSNAQFNKEEITRELLSKLKITPGDKTIDVKKEEGGHDEVEDQKAENLVGDSGNLSTEPLEDSDAEEDDEVVYYDKGKSFFDNITCETTNPRGERMSWTEERKRNSETFGIHWRGRGRGGYRGRGYRGRGRGGYRGRGGGYQYQQRDDGNNRPNYYNNRQNYYNNRNDQYNNRNDYNRNDYNNKSDYNNRNDYNRSGDQQQNEGGNNWRSNNYRGNRGGGWGNNRRQWVNYDYKDDKSQHHRHDKEHSQANEVTATAS